MRVVLFWDSGEIYRLSMDWEVGFIVGFMVGFKRPWEFFIHALIYDLFFCFATLAPRLLRHGSEKLRVECFCAYARYL